MYAVIVNLRVSSSGETNKECLLAIPSVQNDCTASRYIGRKVIWMTKSGKKIVGKIVDVHGRAGVVRARFRKGLPGDAIGNKVALL